MLTEKDCRRRAAKFYLKRLSGVDEDWIETGNDGAYLRDKCCSDDVVDCAKLLWSAIQDDRKARAS